MSRYLLKWEGQIFIVESCLKCPARKPTGIGNGGQCLARRNQPFLRSTKIKNPFPTSPLNPCPVYKDPNQPERALPPVKPAAGKDSVQKDRPSEKLYCCWCDNKIEDQRDAVVLINFPKRGDFRIDHAFCHFEYCRTLDCPKPPTPRGRPG